MPGCGNKMSDRRDPMPAGENSVSCRIYSMPTIRNTVCGHYNVSSYGYYLPGSLYDMPGYGDGVPCRADTVSPGRNKVPAGGNCMQHRTDSLPADTNPVSDH